MQLCVRGVAAVRVVYVTVDTFRQFFTNDESNPRAFATKGLP